MTTTTSQTDVNTNSTTTGGVGVIGGAPGGISSPGGAKANGKNTTSAASTATNGNSGNTQQRAASDNLKRKKLKSRSATSASSLGAGGVGGGGGSSAYAKDHMDAWLENCLRDATNAQLSSSSEFLDINPQSCNRGGMYAQQMQTQQQQQQQQMPNMHNFHNPQQHQQQQQQMTMSQQQQFLLRSNSQPYNSPGTGGSGRLNAPFSMGIQRHMPNYMKSSNSLSNRFPMMFPSSTSNGNGSVGLGFYTQNDDSQDFASLPPIVNMLGGGGLSGGNSDEHNNSTDVLDGSGCNPNMSRGFRFSDPCLLNPSDNDSKMSGQNTPDRRNTSATASAAPAAATNNANDMEQNKFFAALMEQINILHETNSKICRNLHETKVDIEALKHTPNSAWGGLGIGGGGGGMRHRRDSLSGLSTQSQPLIFGGGFGTQSPAPSTFHSGAYTPGMMTDVVREVKEAARVREDALLNRVKSMVEERQWTMNEGNVRILRDIDELKTYVLHLRLERKEINKRLNYLETENRHMRQLLASLYNNRNGTGVPQPDIIYENEALRMQNRSKPFNKQTRRSQSFNLQYGTIHQQPISNIHSLDEEEQQQQHHQQPKQSHRQHLQLAEAEDETGDIASSDVSAQQRPVDMRNSFSSTDSCIGSSSQLAPTSNSHKRMQLTNGSGSSSSVKEPQPIQSPPNFALLSPEQESREQPIKQRSNSVNSTKIVATPTSEKEQLKRELNEAVVARQEADQRIIALEKLVSSLSQGQGQAVQKRAPISNNITNGGGADVGVRSFGESTTTATTNKNATTPKWTTGGSYHNAPVSVSESVSSISSPYNIKANANSITFASASASSPSAISVVTGPITDL